MAKSTDPIVPESSDHDSVHPVVFAAVGGGIVAVGALVVGLLFWPSVERPVTEANQPAAVVPAEKVQTPKAPASESAQASQKTAPKSEWDQFRDVTADELKQQVVCSQWC